MSEKNIKNKFCLECIKYPLKYSKYKCFLCKKMCCSHKSEGYESNHGPNESLYKIDCYWYLISLCHDCIIKKLLEK